MLLRQQQITFMIQACDPRYTRSCGVVNVAWTVERVSTTYGSEWIHCGHTRSPFMGFSNLLTANTKHLLNVDLQLDHRLRRWSNIKLMLGQRLVFSGLVLKIHQYWERLHYVGRNPIWFYIPEIWWYSRGFHFREFCEEDKFANSKISRKLIL